MLNYNFLEFRNKYGLVTVADMRFRGISELCPLAFFKTTPQELKKIMGAETHGAISVINKITIRGKGSSVIKIAEDDVTMSNMIILENSTYNQEKHKYILNNEKADHLDAILIMNETQKDEHFWGKAALFNKITGEVHLRTTNKKHLLKPGIRIKQSHDPKWVVDGRRFHADIEFYKTLYSKINNYIL